jgi:hypothetical protein
LGIVISWETVFLFFVIFVRWKNLTAYILKLYAAGCTVAYEKSFSRQATIGTILVPVTW